MACKEQPQTPPQLTANVVQSLIGDLVQEAVIDHQHHKCLKLSSDSETCQRLYDILGYQPCSESEDNDDFASIAEDGEGDGKLDVFMSCSQCTLYNSPKETTKYQRNWHNWLIDAVNDESSEDEFVLKACRNTTTLARLHTVGVQTEQPRLRLVKNLNTSAPCELTRQTIFIDALTTPGPHALARAPLADRFCYMLTDFASALYCSLAIMCCCTPNMFR